MTESSKWKITNNKPFYSVCATPATCPKSLPFLLNFNFLVHYADCTNVRFVLYSYKQNRAFFECFRVNKRHLARNKPVKKTINIGDSRNVKLCLLFNFIKQFMNRLIFFLSISLHFRHTALNVLDANLKFLAYNLFQLLLSFFFCKWI